MQALPGVRKTKNSAEQCNNIRKMNTVNRDPDKVSWAKEVMLPSYFYLFILF